MGIHQQEIPDPWSFECTNRTGPMEKISDQPGSCVMNVLVLVNAGSLIPVLLRRPIRIVQAGWCPPHSPPHSVPSRSLNFEREKTRISQEFSKKGKIKKHNFNFSQDGGGVESSVGASVLLPPHHELSKLIYGHLASVCRPIVDHKLWFQRLRGVGKIFDFQENEKTKFSDSPRWWSIRRFWGF